MRKYLIAITLSFALAMLTVDVSRSIRNPVPYVYKIDTLPNYGRKRPLKKHYEPDFSAKLQIS
ncbi:MAG: hypothetical protein EPN82_06860 [Bacteroidetes bacterium]|nr:MAG: hypothetical protein EPN82_06860 [Bacteroidota bacterium]